jgi:hypothetical protein
MIEKEQKDVSKMENADWSCLCGYPKNQKPQEDPGPLDKLGRNPFYLFFFFAFFAGFFFFFAAIRHPPFC